MMSKKLVALMCVALFGMNVSFAQQFEYIGAAKCKMCHNKPQTGKQYDIWASSLHANALKSLSSQQSLDYAKKNNIADPTKEKACLKCHATYYNVKEDLIQTLTAQEGVSCESCHGPGSVYKSNAIMKDQAKALASGLILPKKEVCEKCHNKENPFYKPFNFETAVAKIAHPNPAK
ncbi:MAG: cytochrome c family protein [Salinivirgaceae bacterium]|nr:cytochrome c family protein [Salinivirgaceae bacterium]